MAAMGSCVGKTYAEIWEMYRHHPSGLSEAELKRIHDKWTLLGTEFFGSERGNRKKSQAR